MRDWQFATVDVTANRSMKVTVMEMYCNTLESHTWCTSFSPTNGQYQVIFQCIMCPSQLSNVVVYGSHSYIWSVWHDGAQPWMQSIQLWSSWQKTIHHTYCFFSLWLISPNDFGSSANVVGDVFGKISIFSRWWWPSLGKRREASKSYYLETCLILLPSAVLAHQQHGNCFQQLLPH